MVVAVLAVVAAGGVFLAVKLTQGGDGPTVATPVATESATPEPTAAPSSAPPPPPRTTAAPPPQTTTTTTTTTTKVTPPKPVQTVNPATFNATHRLYKTGVMRTVNCKQAKTGPGNGSQALAYFKAIKTCLDRAWPKQVAASGARFRSPGLVVWGGSVNTPCGGGVGRAFYCPTTHTIYMESPSIISFYRQNPTFGRMVGTFTMAHEYAHAVQWMTGLGQAYTKLRYDASAAGALQLSRRLELQASCLGNVFLGANRTSYGITGYAYQMWLYDVNNSGDRPPYPRDHGSTTNHGAWSRAAFQSRNPASCNTWSVSPARVS
ncbi:neutral zinc metallopeptidase [Kribbella sindirgiensis]|uniref:neutral zinc metallopeptidase n=1 Tax=Kribbella sindirgiensis TaxID=1124744 RepID=UPI0013F4B76D|nr:neutral zinc metallopeptidase [Kribbella sindirgiensis]